ncbi:Gfo/Idh/MocA family protein [Bailinhaonella thermotolerans]|uniref:Gfo/Idh/MocA family protein n=1 Tax=Bailinhaonella thermotolerans TaxID=1070861 RepID=UPI00192A565B|nr:Gfo/Idh/MocA family oxidoreductase [Bailinhaonella thermotolerans]
MTVTNAGPHLLLVGLGNRSTRLLRALRTARTPLRVSAVVDPAPTTGDRVAELVGEGLLPGPVPVHQSVEEALAAGRPEVALVAGPHDTHQAAVLALARAGVAVWKEKPYALTLADAAELAALPHPGVRVMAHRPHGPLLRQAMAQLPEWGRLLSYRIRITRPTGDYSGTWRADRARSGGGAICDLGYHAFDLIARIAPDPVSVYAVTPEPPAHRPPVDVEERAWITVNHRGGCRGLVELSRCDEQADDVELVAEHGRFDLTGDRARFEMPEHVGLAQTVESTSVADPWSAMLRHHAATLTDRRITAEHARLGLIAVALTEAAYTSLDNQSPAFVADTSHLEVS